MNLRQLQAFVAVMETGLISQAARKIGVNQPAVSKIIRAMESEIGIDLFAREKGRLKATPEAFYLESVAKNVFNQLNDASQFLKDYGNSEVGELRVMGIPGPTLFFIPRVISDFVREHERVNTALFAWTSSLVVSWIANHQMGIGLAEWYEPHPAVQFHPISLRCFCALPRDHYLASHKIITPKLLSGVPLATIHATHPLYLEIERVFRQEQCSMNVKFHSDLFVPTYTFIENNGVVNIVDPISASSYQQYSRNSSDVIFRRFEPDLVLHLSVVSPAHVPLSGTASNFHEKLITELEQLNERDFFAN
jgi:DNA-binding transcriptional LysR family regulator